MKQQIKYSLYYYYYYYGIQWLRLLLRSEVTCQATKYGTYYIFLTPTMADITDKLQFQYKEARSVTSHVCSSTSKHVLLNSKRKRQALETLYTNHMWFKMSRSRMTNSPN